MTELARYEAPNGAVETTYLDPTGGRLVAWAESLRAAHQIGTALAGTSFVPKQFQGRPDECAAAILCGDELGLTPTQALRSIFVINGTPGLYAKAMVALVQSKGHEVRTELDTPAKVIVRGKRRGSSHVEESEWTVDRARRAGYTSNKKYETDPQAMLWARAAAEVCRRIAADVLSGIPFTVEELELEESAGKTTTVRREVGPAVKRTAKRAAPPPAPRVAEEPELDEPEATAETVETHDGSESVTSSQLRNLGRLCTAQGLTDREEALGVVSSLIGREITSRNDLTKEEASRVIDAFEADIAAREARDSADDE